MRRHGKWALVAVLLFGLAGWLMMRGDGEAMTQPERTVELPRRFTQAEHERMERRRTLPAPVQAAGSPARSRPRDPVLAALAAPAGTSAVVIEANAIRNSPLGELLLRCLLRQQGENPFEEMKEHLGVDLLQDLDRVAVTENGLVLSGNFKNAKWDALVGKTASSFYGDQGTLFTAPGPGTGEDGAPRARTLARWGDQVLYVGASPQAAQDAIDRIEGRSAAPTVLDESKTYGEIYGVLSSADLSHLLPPDQAELAARIRTVASQVELHVDTSNDVGIVTTLQGPDHTQVEDLGKALGAALSLGRIQAQVAGSKDVAELLEFAKVVPGHGSFNLELALPLSVIEKNLAFCRPRPAKPSP